MRSQAIALRKLKTATIMASAAMVVFGAVFMGPCLFPSAIAQAAPIPDPMGDAAPGAGSFLDIASVDAVFGGGSLTFTMTLFPGPGTPILPPSSGAPFSLVGAVEFDVDLNPLTGAPPFQDLPRSVIGHPLSGLGVEFAADLFSEAASPGLISIVAPTLGPGVPVGFVPIVYGPLSLSFSIPLAMLGGDDGLVNYAAIIGDFSGPTDAAPAVFGTSAPAVPEPASLLLMGSGLVGLAAWRRKRKV